MKCPQCGFKDTKVYDSRDANEGIRRRRECLSCSFRFTTYESVRTGNMIIIKKDKRREDFNRDKLMTGIRKACEKRPLPTGIIEKMVDEIEAELIRMGKAEIPSSVVGGIVMEKLKKLDHIAYIRFASVYRDFADITSLKREVDTLIAGKEVASQLPLLPEAEIGSPVKRKRVASVRH
ncbi:MAG: transcriptional repressor NrdR [Chloroflexi bacterium]|nr:transcriptional repressor NrdR [Chloroflexota bacterium]